MFWEWRGKNKKRRVFMYYDAVHKKNVRLRVGEIPSNILTDADADNFCKIKEGEIDSARLRIERRLAWKSRYYNFDSLLDTFKSVRLMESPNNWQNDIYYLEQYVFDFFLNHNSYSNINDWYLHYEDFKNWLNTTKTARGNNHLAYSTKNQIIKSMNAFLKILKRRNLIERHEQCFQFARHLEKTKDVEAVISESDKDIIFATLLETSKVSAYFFKVLTDTGLRINEGLGLSLDDLVQGQVNNKSLNKQLEKEGIEYFGYLNLQSQPKSRMELRGVDGIVARKPLKGKKTISSQNSRTIPIFRKETFNMLAELWITQKANFDKKLYGSDPKNYLLFDGLNKNIFGNHLREACQRNKIRPYTPHCCRHTFATEFTGMVMGNIFLCSLVLGHADTSTTRKYIHLWEQIQKDLKSEAQLKDGISLIE